MTRQSLMTCIVLALLPHAVTAQPDIACYTPPGWSGPLVIHQIPDEVTTPAILDINEPFLASFGYQNLGSTFTTPGVRTVLQNDLGSTLFDVPFPPLPSIDFNQSRREFRQNRQIFGTLGVRTFTITYDPGNGIPESNENNNSCSVTVLVSAPDLNFVGTPTLTTESGDPVTSDDEPAFLTAQWSNTGDFATTAYNVQISLNGAPQEIIGFPSLAPGTGDELVLNPLGPIPAGVNEVTIRLNSTGEFREIDSSPASNVATITVEVTNPCPADLDGDGLATFFDAIVFLQLFDADDPAADVSGNGVLSAIDVLTFLETLLNGCP